MNVTLIGSGNVATVLGKLIRSAGHVIVEVYSRDILHATTLATELNAKAVSDVSQLSLNADLFLIAVSDAAIGFISETLRLPGKIVVHTSGAISKKELANISDSYGVIYPLQSLRKEAEHFPEIPLLIDGSNVTVINLLEEFAKSISGEILLCNDEQRLKLHVAAVVVSNFTNYLYALTADYCKKEQVDFSILSALIKEVANRTSLYEPGKMQTGPAVRGDGLTIQKHLQLLHNYPGLHKLYGEMTESIKKFYNV